MAIKIIKKKEEHLRKMCLNCGSTLKFSKNDIKYEEKEGFMTIEMIYVMYINCPVCNEKIKLGAKTKEEFKNENVKTFRR